MAGSFALDIDRFADKARARMELVIRKIALDIFTRVVNRTPVRSGRARGNWAVGLNAYPTEVTGNASDPLPDIERAIAQAVAGDAIYLVNSVPYIGVLEYGGYSDGPRTVGGFSVQAPQGMVRITLLEYPGVVQTAAEEAKRDQP